MTKEYTYMRADKCTFAQLEAGLAHFEETLNRAKTKEAHSRARTKRDSYKAALARVAPTMKGTNKTLGEILKGG